MSGGLCEAKTPAHDLTHYCIPRFQPPIPPIYRRLSTQLGCHFDPGTGQERIIFCALCTLYQMEKNYPATKLECLAIVWAIAKQSPYLMSNKFDIYTDHYKLQWLKYMRIGFALLHRWSVAWDQFDFTIHHQPGKDQGHVDGLSHLPVEDASPDRGEVALLVRTLTIKEAARQASLELHRAIHVGVMSYGRYSGIAAHILEASKFALR